MVPLVPYSSLIEVCWPAAPMGADASILAVLFQLEKSQWWSPGVLHEHQFAQLEQLVEHSFRTVPFHRDRLVAAGYAEGTQLTPELWAEVPILTRAELQRAGSALQSTAAPSAHGTIHEVHSSGSTGTPIRVATTSVSQLMAGAFTIRSRLWHKLDSAKTMCVIRSVSREIEEAWGGEEKLAYPEGLQLDRWPDSFGETFPTGPGIFLPIQTDVARQAEWLQRQNPHYLRTFPSNALALAQHCLEHGIELPQLECVLMGAELLTPEVRATCRQVWAADTIDHYGARETDWLAFQCPGHEHYHVQSEAALVEVLDEDGRPCGPGEVGRVVVTPLHNFAMPLLRYSLGDFAEVGAPCSCGRGLPVLTRILGRSRNMLRLPSGTSVWPALRASQFREAAPVRQFQLVQKGLEHLELRLVVERPLTQNEEIALRRMVVREVGYPFAIRISFHDEIARGPGGKYEDFSSELTEPAGG